MLTHVEPMLPPPLESPWTVDLLGQPAAGFVVFGTPAPQGSKKHVGGGRMVESSSKVKPWRKNVHSIASFYAGDLDAPLDGPLVVDMVFTLEKGHTLPKWLDWHFRTPDLSKLARSTEDALTTAGLWADDARVTAYRRLEKRYIGSDDPDTLGAPGALVRVWTVPDHLIDARKTASRTRKAAA